MGRTDSCGLENLDVKQTKPFPTARQDDRDIIDCKASSLVSTVRRRIPSTSDAGAADYCRPRSCVQVDRSPSILAPLRSPSLRHVTSGPSSQSYRAGSAEPQSTLSRERFSPVALLRHHEATPSCPLLGAKRSCRKHRLRSESDVVDGARSRHRSAIG